MTADAKVLCVLPQTTIFAVARFAVGENTAALCHFALMSTCANLHWRPKGNACEHMFVCLCACLFGYVRVQCWGVANEQS